MRDVGICIIGGGGRQWAIQFMKDLAACKDVRGKVTLYDIDRDAAEENVSFGERIMALNDCDRFSVSARSDLDNALEGADIVVISIEPGRTECRYGDLVLPERYGILQSVGDTTGPGGIMRARRAVPLFVEFAKAIERRCPDAWVINYTNPMTLCTAALFVGFPGIKAMGCCHEVFGTQSFIAELVGLWFDRKKPDRREIYLDIAGVNHFTFATRVMWNGIDLMPSLREMAADPASYPDLTEKARGMIANEKWFESDHRIALSFLRDFGALGAAGDRHLAEFVPWFLSSDEELMRYGVVRTPYSWRIRKAEEKRHAVFSDEELASNKGDEEGVDIVRSLMGDGMLRTNVNRPNEGQISFLPKGRIVESYGIISADSIVPLIATDPPIGVQNLIGYISDVQQMTLDAIVSNDDEALFKAFLSDPLMRLPRTKARELFDSMLDACRLVY